MYRSEEELLAELNRTEEMRLHIPQSRCPFCGTTPFVEQQIHGHYYCVNCNTVTNGCCDGSG